ncbi:MAG: phage tail tape measure protein [Rhodobacterales bacterium]|nr:MAG: phage tail tape measure protein [Rhodobacterales bacterium]
MPSDLNIALILKLVDQVSGPAKSAVSSLKNIGAASEKVGTTGMKWAKQQEAANQVRMASARGELMGIAAIGASFAALTEPAIRAEQRMAEIAKVVEFNGPNGINLLQRDIRELVSSGGLATTAEGVSDIVAAAGRMGVVDANLPDEEKRRGLLEFAASASKMSVAFGISADLAGTSLARWRQNFGLTQDQAMQLGDTINLLGNTMATNEADILNVVNRMGTVAQSAGLATDEMAALSATLLAAGSSPEIAATGMKNFLNALTKGEAATKRQQAAFAALGIDHTELAKRMQVDATGGIMSVVDAFAKIEPYRRNSLVGDLFGEEGKMAIMPLINQADLLRTTFEKTADTASLLGLMEQEYQRQAQTTFAQRQRLFEYIKGLSVVIGSTLLPALNELFATLMPIVSQFTAWVEANPELVSGILKIGAGLLALKFASVVARLAVFSIIGPFLRLFRVGSGVLKILPKIGRKLAAIRPLKWGKLIGKLAWGRFIKPISWVTLSGGKFLLSKLVAPIKWGASLIPAIKWGSMAGRLGKLGMTAGGWGKLITPLKWFGRGALRFIPVIGWAAMAAEIGLFAWEFLGLKELPWRDYLNKAIEWKDWFFSFEWKELLPSWDWLDIIPKFNLAERLFYGEAEKMEQFDKLAKASAETPGPSGLSGAKQAKVVAQQRDRLARRGISGEQIDRAVAVRTVHQRAHRQPSGAG